MFLRPNHHSKDGKDHTYWSLVETVRTNNRIYFNESEGWNTWGGWTEVLRSETYDCV